MKRQFLLRMRTVFFLVFLCCVATGTAQSPDPATGKVPGEIQIHETSGAKVILGEIQIPETSGAAFLPGDRLLVVKDEGQTIFMLEQASQKLLTGKVTEADFKKISLKDQFKGADGKVREVDDLEDVAWDGQSNVFLITSHSRNRQGKSPAKRSAIVRMILAPDGLKPDKVFDLEVPPDLQASMERTPAQAGFNIEGVAWTNDGRLLLGLRSPTQTVERDLKPNEDAVLLEVRDLSANSLEAAVVKPVLNLKGSGIRGMSYDPEEKGLWIVAGLSPDPPDGIVEKANSALWFLHDNGTLNKIELPAEVKTGLANVEAVARVSIGESKQPHLLLVEDGLETSKYVLFPVPKR
jgi:hypothetical protein